MSHFVCRLCGTETVSQNRLINIYGNSVAVSNIKSKIAYCLGINFCENYNLPSFLCPECVDNVEKFNDFKIKCHKTALFFQNWLKTNKLTYNNDIETPTQDIKIEKDENISVNSNMCIFEEVNVDELCKNNVVSNTDPSSILPSEKKPIASINKRKLGSHLRRLSFTEDVDDEKSKTSTEYKCPKCPRVANTKKKIQVHMKKHSNIRHYCLMCDKNFKCELSLKLHIKKHNKEYDYICDFCGKCFVAKSHFESHMKFIHIKDYKFQCTKCEKKFITKHGLKTHDVYKHSNTYNYTCNICNKQFKLPCDLVKHKITHKPIEKRKQYKCTICVASFLRKEGLKTHMFSHTGELKYGCDHCDNRYKYKEGLKIHLLIHTGVKNHICEICGKAFALNSSLVDHRRIHTGERPFVCKVCQKSFNQKSALNRHNKKPCSEKK